VACRETASKILNEYLASVGGKEQILTLWEEKKAEAAQKKGKKRGRASTGTPQNGANGAKRSRKVGGHPGSETPPASAKQAEFKPPSGNWEDEVVHIDACEGNDQTVVVYLTWKGGQKSQHPLAQVYKRCPQKVMHSFGVCLEIMLTKLPRCLSFTKATCWSPCCNAQNIRADCILGSSRRTMMLKR
jgi:chromobox protein 1